MENKKDNIIRILICIIVLGVLFTISINKPYNVTPTPIDSCKEDSLQKVINQLEIDLINEEDGWDKKERRYEDILFEYEFGLERLKNYHPEAYKDFHRIIGYKEKYSHETERENKKRLQSAKW